MTSTLTPELDIEIHALKREKDAASEDRRFVMRKECADVDEQLRPLEPSHTAKKERSSDETANVRRRIDELRVKADDAEGRCDLATVSDLRYYAILTRRRSSSRSRRARPPRRTTPVSSRPRPSPRLSAGAHHRPPRRHRIGEVAQDGEDYE